MSVRCNVFVQGKSFLSLLSIVCLTIVLPGCGGSPVPTVEIPTDKSIAELEKKFESIETPDKPNADYAKRLEKHNHQIPTETDHYCIKNYYKDVAAFGDKNFAKQYKSLTSDSGKAKTAGINFMETLGRAFTGDSKEVELQPLINAAVKAGSKDPLIRCEQASYLTPVEAKKVYAEWLPKLLKSKYSGFHKAANCLRYQNAGFEVQMIETLVLWAQETHDQPVMQREVWAKFSTFLSNNHPANQEKFYRAVLHSDSIDPWIRHMTAGQFHQKKAWKSRGHGFVDQVTEAGFQGFRTHLKQARDHFVAAWKLCPDNPNAAREMIGIAMTGETKDSTREWFERAIEAQIDYMPAYNSYVYSLTPRWGGTHEAMIDFGMECLDSGRFDVHVPWFLIDILVKIQAETERDGAIWREERVYAALKKMSEGFAKQPRYKDDGQPNSGFTHNWSFFAAAAVNAEDYDTAFTIFEQLKGRESRLQFEQVGISSGYAKALTYAMKSEAVDAALDLESYLKTFANGEPPFQPDGFVKLANSSVDDVEHPSAKAYFRNAATRIGDASKYYSGDWVELKFDPQLVGYRVSAESYVVEDERTVLLSSLAPASEYFEHLSLQSLTPFKPPYVIEVEVIHPESESVGAAGIEIGNVDRRALHTSQAGHLFFVDSQSGACGVVKREGPYYGLRAGQRIGSNKLQLRAWPERFEFRVNNATVANETMYSFQPANNISFGDALPRLRRGKVRFRNARVRQLTLEPPPEDKADKNQYYAKALRFDPTDAKAWMNLGLAKFYDDQTLAALEHFLIVEELSPSSRGLNYFLGLTWHKLRRFDKAKPLLEKAALDAFNMNISYSSADSDRKSYLPALKNLGWVLAASSQAKNRDGQHAIHIAQDAHGIAQDWSTTSLRAAAYAEFGNYEEAVKLANEAKQSAPQDNASFIDRQIEAYSKGKPLRIFSGIQSPTWASDTAPKNNSISDETKKALIDAGGFVHPRFVVAQTLDMKTVETLVDELKPIGYRPVQLRPYQVGDTIQVAAIWTRDNLEWQHSIGLTADEISAKNKELSKNGFTPIDVAAYQFDDDVRYQAIWLKSDHEVNNTELYVGVPAAGHKAKWDPIAAAGHYPLRRHLFVSKEGQFFNSMIWQNPMSKKWAFDDGSKSDFETKQASERFQLDVSIVGYTPKDADEGALNYGGVWSSAPGWESAESHGESPMDHLKACRQFAANGFRPVSIAVATVPGKIENDESNKSPLIAASVWHKDLASEVEAKVTNANGNYEDLISDE